MRRVLIAWFVLAFVAACQATPPNPMTFNFDRPADVALLCAEVPITPDGHIIPNSRMHPITLDQCATGPDGTLYADSYTAPNGQLTGRREFAVVTQRERGELAVVNLHALYDTGIVDNDPNVPGFTFIPVGMFPGAVAVDPRGFVTYVANTGDNSVTVIDNSRLLLGEGPREISDAAVMGFVQHRYIAHPSDVHVDSFRGRYYLYVALPDAGAVAVTDVTDPTTPGAPVYITLGSHVPNGDAGMMPSCDGGTAPLDGGSPDAADASDGGTGASARPYRLAASPDQTTFALGTLYVSDLAQPVVHVLHPDPASVLVEDQPLVADTPTQYLTVTPPTPAAMPNTQFVYVSSATDGTLLVLDTTTRHEVLVNALLDRPECQVGSPQFDLNRCPKLIPNPNRFLDPITDFYRVPLVAPVRALAVATRDALQAPVAPGNVNATVSVGYNPPGAPNVCVQRLTPAAPVAPYVPAIPGTNAMLCDDPWGNQVPSPEILRGIEVLVTTRSGQLQVVDVEDYQADCTGRRDVPEQPPVQQHTLRPSENYLAIPGAITAPTLALNLNPLMAGQDIPAIVPIGTPAGGSPTTTCDATNNYCVQLPTITGTNTINALGVREETWTLTYEGPLPLLSLNAGRLDVAHPIAGTPSDFPVNDQGAAFCANGVQPRTSSYPGDHLVLTQPSPCIQDPVVEDAGPSVQRDYATCSGGQGEAGIQICQDLFGTSIAPCNRDFIITQADQDHLVVEVPSAVIALAGEPTRVFGDISGCARYPTPDGTPFTDPAQFLPYIHQCYAEAAPFEIRPTGQWTVVGSLTGYKHNVVVDSCTNMCTVDPNRFPTGRLLENVAYSNNSFTMQINQGVRTTTDANGNVTRMPAPTIRGTSYQFAITGGFNPLVLDAGVLPNAIYYSCPNNRFYIADEGRSGLVEYGVDPISVSRTFN